MTLVEDLRRLVGAGSAQYTAAGSSWWTDAQLQAALDDRRRLYQRGLIDFYTDVVAPSGSAAYTRGVIGVQGKLEPGTAAGGTANNVGTIVDSQGSTITGWTIHDDGHVIFTANQGGSARYFNGYAYDLYAAAADVLEAWASTVKTRFDFSTDDQSFDRSQAHKMLLEQAHEYRGKQIMDTVPMKVSGLIGAAGEHGQRGG